MLARDYAVNPIDRRATPTSPMMPVAKSTAAAGTGTAAAGIVRCPAAVSNAAPRFVSATGPCAAVVRPMMFRIVSTSEDMRTGKAPFMLLFPDEFSMVVKDSGSAFGISNRLSLLAVSCEAQDVNGLI